MATKTAIPSTEGKFTMWVRHLAATLEEAPTAYGLTAEQTTELNGLVQTWDTDLDGAVRARDAARAATEQKDESRVELTKFVRLLSRLIQANPNVTDAQRRDAGLPVHKTHPTPAPVPKTMPLGQVIATDRLEHMVSFVDALTPTRRAKPDGVAACEIYVAIGDAAPADERSYNLMAVATRSPHKVTFREEDGNKTAHYLLRWTNSKSEAGPWSHSVSATIPAV